MISVSYIWHDCFAVQTDRVSLVFDYWVDSDGIPREKPGFLDSPDRQKPLYVFVSHFHKDHYNPAIFAWAKDFAAIRYIVSIDVWKRMRHIVSKTSVYSGPKVEPSKVTVLKPGDTYRDEYVRITAYPSTDTGNSYMVEVGGRKIFHAGDLNAWMWKDESTEQEVNKAIGDFRACLRQIKAGEKGDTIDICFFPVDSRIGRDYWEGASIFVREFDVSRFFPMHFALGDEEERKARQADALAFDKYANPERGVYVDTARDARPYVID